MAAHSKGCSCWWSRTRRTARCRTSGEYFFDVFMTPSSQSLESPAIPGRFSQWRHLPREFAPWTTVYYYFRQWKRTLISRLHGHLRRAVRTLAGRESTPSLGIIDAQSVKTTRRGGLRGFDG